MLSRNNKIPGNIFVSAIIIFLENYVIIRLVPDWAGFWDSGAAEYGPQPVGG